jgi:hypothetical protein
VGRRVYGQVDVWVGGASRWAAVETHVAACVGTRYAAAPPPPPDELSSMNRYIGTMYIHCVRMTRVQGAVSVQIK